ncbi:HK97-gp10 family putative phage morphogenesis protein [Caldinitratiruptor microaerophilus]|uniref:Phage protein, HK97 gp10 family n=1 Tax=Caldinitratiruptor microaerophilus TaxID=671077 RepID=A0AA35CQY9_9FIRM|nr:HK97-gp10 family putative phage morphogenesis protein [Caldinitratiruptor microaerophilus]BDG59639.1 hypothetical protein caldi_07290 [Caldinitratiruptor microaerophilus]BDG62336.1 hypothetical protein caldi_34260 [Caldinitratiruptor microaerophilus]
MKAEIKGARELIRAFDRLSDELKGQVLAEAAKAGAEVIRAEASRRAPRKTGDLARSIVAEVLEQAPGKVTVGVGPDKDRFYGRFVEFGHALVRGARKAEKKVVGHVPPHPFLRPALDEGAERAKQAIADELKAAIERAAKG